MQRFLSLSPSPAPSGMQNLVTRASSDLPTHPWIRPERGGFLQCWRFSYPSLVDRHTGDNNRSICWRFLSAWVPITCSLWHFLPPHCKSSTSPVPQHPLSSRHIFLNYNDLHLTCPRYSFHFQLPVPPARKEPPQTGCFCFNYCFIPRT